MLGILAAVPLLMVFAFRFFFAYDTTIGVRRKTEPP